MIIEPKTLSARGARVELSEVNILLNLVNGASSIVRLNILDTLTHLPLTEQGWTQVRILICQELQETASDDDKAHLLEMESWIPYSFIEKNEATMIEKKSRMQKNLHVKVDSIHNQYNNHYVDYDPEWIVSKAPGFVLLSESELQAQKSLLLPDVSKIATKILNGWTDERLLDIKIENPALTTLLFEYAAKDNYYKVLLMNNLLEQIGRLENFRPDLNGLFEEYYRCVIDWIRYYSQPNARWFQVNRDDENMCGWNSWQIAWTVSRGGLTGLISALATHLNATDETRQIAALALIADSADYTLQRRAAVFGGGIRPPRLDPSQTHRFWLSGTKENEQKTDSPQSHIDLKQLLNDISEKYFKITVGHPKLISKGYESPFVIQLYFKELTNSVKMKIKEIAGENYAEHVYNTELKFGQVVKIKLYSTDITFPEEVVKKLDSPVNSMTFLGKPLNTCKPGEHKVTLSVLDNETGIEYQSETFSVKVVDYAFDHVSRPLFSAVSTVVLGMGTFGMFVLTLLEQIDKTIGLRSGTAVGVLAAASFTNFYNLYQRIRQNTP